MSRGPGAGRASRPVGGLAAIVVAAAVWGTTGTATHFAPGVPAFVFGAVTFGLGGARARGDRGPGHPASRGPAPDPGLGPARCRVARGLRDRVLRGPRRRRCRARHDPGHRLVARLRRPGRVGRRPQARHAPLARGHPGERGRHGRRHPRPLRARRRRAIARGRRRQRPGRRSDVRAVLVGGCAGMHAATSRMPIAVGRAEADTMRVGGDVGVAAARAARGPNERGLVGAVFGMAAVPLVVLAVVAGGPFLAEADDWPVFLYLALVPTVIGHSLYAVGLRSVTASVATLLSLLEPVVAAVLAVLVVGEHLGLGGWTGIVLVVVGLSVLALPARRSS
ncbi:DMT family transporter [Curtobacterium flaccumfaciens]|nr:DMT family transporter [Curtobacterium flaccumfaciens]